MVVSSKNHKKVLIGFSVNKTEIWEIMSQSSDDISGLKYSIKHIFFTIEANLKILQRMALKQFLGNNYSISVIFVFIT